MSKSFLKNLLLFFLPFIFVILFLGTVYPLFHLYSKNLARFISSFWTTLSTVQRANFSPFKGIELNNVDVTDAVSKRHLTAGKIAIQFSLIALFQGKWQLKNIEIDGFSTSGTSSSGSLWDDFSRMFRVKNPEERLKITFDKAIICSRNSRLQMQDEASGRSSFLAGDFCVDLRFKKIACHGTIDFKNSSWLNKFPDAANYFSRKIGISLNLEAVGEDLLVDSVKIDWAPYVFLGTGMVRNFSKDADLDIRFHSGDLRLEDLAFLKAFKPQGGSMTVTASLTGKFTNPVIKSEWIMPVADFTLEKDKLQIEHFLFLADYHLRENSLFIKDLNGIVDGILKASLNGRIRMMPVMALDMKGSLAQIPQTEKKTKINELLIALKGNLAAGRFSGDVHLVPRGVLEPRQYVCTLRNFAFVKDLKYPGMFMFIENMVLKETMSTDKTAVQDYFLDQVTAKLRFKGKRTFIDSIDITGYGGKILISGNLYLSRQRNDFLFDIILSGLNLKDIKTFYPVYGELSGVVSGRLKAEKKEQFSLQALVEADGFKLAKLDPLDKIADFIGINSIKEISGGQLLIDFDLTGQNSTFKRFDLDSAGISMRSYFQVDGKKWLEGHVALSLPRTVLAESKIFKTLMSIARERNEFLDFVVQVNGFLGSLRTELVKSDLRDKLKERISPGTQQLIEKKIGEAMIEQGQKNSGNQTGE